METNTFRDELVTFRNGQAVRLNELQCEVGHSGDEGSTREFFLTRKRLHKANDLLRELRSFQEAVEAV